MTSEEAIENLKSEEISIIGKDGFPNYNLINAHIIAIEALQENTKLKAEIEQLKAELEQSQEQWCLKASDNTDYVLAYADGMYCLSDSTGSIVCEFLKGKVEE